MADGIDLLLAVEAAKRQFRLDGGTGFAEQFAVHAQRIIEVMIGGCHAALLGVDLAHQRHHVGTPGKRQVGMGADDQQRLLGGGERARDIAVAQFQTA